jgi:hypothetical protein
MQIKWFSGWLLLAALALSACSEESAAPNFKPYPVKESKPTPAKGEEENKSPMAGKVTQSLQALKSDIGGDADPVKVAKALKARPPTSGPEPMLLLDKNKVPLIPVLHNTIKLNYYECDGLVAPWFRELVVAEMNYFSALISLPLVDGQHCVVSIGTPSGLTPGRISIDIHETAERLKDCLSAKLCAQFRSVSLIEKGTTLYRSYFLSDMSRKMMSRQCVTNEGKWFKDKNCYDVSPPPPPPPKL